MLRLTKAQKKIIILGISAVIFLSCSWLFVYLPQKNKLALIKEELAQIEAQRVKDAYGGVDFMIENKGFGCCGNCATEEVSLQNLIVIGQQVNVLGKSRSVYTFYQCSRCGHVWQHVEDSGLGGHGSHYSRLTKP